MATVLENLQTALENVTAELAAMNATAAGGKPNAGKSGIDHQGYRRLLMDQITQLQAQITAQQSQDYGAFEIQSEMTT